MEFLKALFDGDKPITYAELVAKAKTVNINAVNIADGAYVSKAKFDDKVTSLTSQVNELQGQIAQRDTDMGDLKSKLNAAKADAEKLGEAQQTLTSLQSKYDSDRQAWETKVQKQAYEFSIREKANGLKFTSPAAKRDFIREATSKEFKFEGNKLLGLDDFISTYAEENKGAIAEDEIPDANPPAIVAPSGNGGNAPDKNAFAFQFTGVRTPAKE